MTTSQTRLFMLAMMALALVVLVVTVANVPGSSAMPEAEARGMGVWRANGCEGCHTLMGHGGTFASDLTWVVEMRGYGYARDLLNDPAAFHPDGRVMPRPGLTRDETDDLLAFLAWAGGHAPAAFPPPPVLLAGEPQPNVSAVARAVLPDDLPDDPIERGRLLFMQPPAACATCHSLEPDVVIVGPSLAGIAMRAGSRVQGQDAEAYIRESILHPSAFIVPSFPDAMAKNLGDVLTSDQINDLMAFLMTLGES